MTYSPKLPPEAVALIKHFEGCRLDAYADAVGVPTIGYGHTGGVRRGASITPEQADQLLRFDLNTAQADVLRHVRVPLNENEYGALVSLAFNIGGSAFARSTCVKKLNAGDRLNAAQEIERFCKGHVNGRAVTLKGLELRRKAEHELFLCQPGEASKDGYLFVAGQTIPLSPDHIPEPPMRAAVLAPIAPPPPKHKASKQLALAAGIGGSVGAVPALGDGQSLSDEISTAWHNAGGPSILPDIQNWSADMSQCLMQLPHADDVRALMASGTHFLQSHQGLALVLGAVALFMLRTTVLTFLRSRVL